MNARVSYVIVGLFVLTLGVVLGFGVVWFGTDGVGADTRRYVVYMSDSVSGLNVDSPVRFNGVKVGGVAAIELDHEDPRRVRLLLDIRRDIPVKTDTVATLQMQGVTGLVHVNLEGGSPQAPALRAPPDRPYPVIEARPSALARLDEKASVLVDNLVETTALLNDLLRQENRESLERILANVESASARLAGHAESVGRGVSDFNAAMNNTRRASAELPALVGQLEEGAGSVTAMARELAETGRMIRREVEETAPGFGRFAQQALPDAAVLISELRRTAENLRQISAELQRDPSILLYGSPRPTAGPGE